MIIDLFIYLIWHSFIKDLIYLNLICLFNLLIIDLLLWFDHFTYLYYKLKLLIILTDIVIVVFNRSVVISKQLFVISNQLVVTFDRLVVVFNELIFFIVKNDLIFLFIIG